MSGPGAGARATRTAPGAVYLHDDTTEVVETLTAEIEVKQPRELADCTRAFAGLAETAVHGAAARALE